MSRFDITEPIIAQLETIRGKELTPEERDEIVLWEKGRSLAHQVNAPGWDVVLEMLQSYATNEIETLARTDPSNRDAVLAAHAIFYAANGIFVRFKEDVFRAIEASRKTPESLKQGFRGVSPVPPESL